MLTSAAVSVDGSGPERARPPCPEQATLERKMTVIDRQSNHSWESRGHSVSTVGGSGLRHVSALLAWILSPVRTGTPRARPCVAADGSSRDGALIVTRRCSPPLIVIAAACALVVKSSSLGAAFPQVRGMFDPNYDL
jgi:hypothetical protein